jgi:hypothetical protein
LAGEQIQILDLVCFFLSVFTFVPDVLFLPVCRVCLTG